MSHNKITWKLKNLMRMKNYEESTGAGCDKGHRDMMCYRSDRCTAASFLCFLLKVGTCRYNIPVCTL